MITITTTSRPGQVPVGRAGTRTVASVDVEWTKNYRIKDGNVPFCYSVVYLTVPAAGAVDPDAIGVQVTSRYVEDPTETMELVAAAATELDRCLVRADLVVGHQLSSDLGVLAAAARTRQPTPACEADIADARAAWHARHSDPRHAGAGRARRGPRVLDTRYDAEQILTGHSRRLVDVCTELGLHVTQPELRGTSMTAVHRRWLDHGEVQARERVTVLNLRHSLSAALVALKATGRLPVEQVVDVNRMLTDRLPDTLDWLRHPLFTSALLPAV